MKIRVIKNLITKKVKNDNSKIYIGISLELLRAVWGQFSFRQFLVPAYTSSQGLQVPFNVASGNYRVLICCTYHFQSSSLFFVYFGFLCLQVSSVSNFCPDARGRRWPLIQAHLLSHAVGREEHCKQISLVCGASACSVWATQSLPQPTVCVFFPVLYCSAFALHENCLKRALHCVHFPGLSHSCSSRFQGTSQMQTQLGLLFVLFPGPSSSGDQVLGEYTLSMWVSASYHLRGPSCSVSLISSRAPSQVFCVSPPES